MIIEIPDDMVEYLQHFVDIGVDSTKGNMGDPESWTEEEHEALRFFDDTRIESLAKKEEN